ncbi:unnamed protein product [Porites evermanni]|uniref:Uncharacterized protein n=1 Tax=Porites evermanni TaxID=104178 RepID=A0ABN8LY92_9CNID|nr:unnamed protein product [Porites evermanni]
MEASSSVGQIFAIKVWVFREPAAAKLHQDKNGHVELEVIHRKHDVDKYYFSVNLDSVYDGPFAPVYQLARVEMEKRNAFQLLVELSFHNGVEEETQQFYSKPFTMRSKPRRKRQQSDSSRQGCPQVNFLGSAAFRKLQVIDHLDAKRAHIEHLIFEVQEAGDRKADIGYHFRLKDPNVSDDFEEGDVVGFFNDDDGHLSIQLLDNKNGKDAFMAGVISRSAYLTATPPMNEKGWCFSDDNRHKDATDVVCVIGVIQVKCMGSVRAGERIYATVDPENPGTAIPESNLPPSVLLSQSSILLGMSMGEKRSPKLDDVNMVQCFVCIVLGITDGQITSEIETIYDRFKMDLNVKLQKERKKYRRMLCISLTVLIFVIGLAIFLLVEYLYPGSALRYKLCRKGSLDGTSSFNYITFCRKRCTTNGIEFRWGGLKQKLSPELEHVAPITRNSQKFHYYLNVDRCAYGGSLKLSANVKGISNRKQVCGPIIFAVNSNCTAVYYYQDAPNAGWKRYQSVRYYPELQRRLKCKFK